MTGTIRYLRARRVPGAVAALGMISFAAFLVARVMVGAGEFAEQALIPVVVVGPAAAAVAALITLDEPSLEIALAAPFRLGVARALQMTILMLGAVVVFAPLGQFEGMRLGFPAAARNVVGYTGLGLVVGPWAGATWAWIAPTVYVVSALTIEGAARTGTLLFWSTRPDWDTASWAVAALLMAAGLVACLIDRPGRVGDGEEA
ncbi:MAG: hypothetical protein H0T94_03520 [Acidimicrobiia bacterium]|nr:hypothetical protein [Acidimicrobiia bacterium]